MKLKLILLTIVLFVGSLFGYGQATLPVARTAWQLADPTGWTHTSTANRNTAFACSGNDGETFDATNDRIVLFFNAAPNQLIFKLKNASMSGASSLLVEQSANGTAYTTLGTYGTAGGATAITDCANITHTLLAATRYIRWTYTRATGNCDIDDVSVSVAATPTITTSTTTNNLFVYKFGAGPSQEQSFTVSGANLTGNLALTAPTNYEISLTSGGTFSGTLSLTPSSGTVASTPIYVRLKSSLAVAAYSAANITAASTGATTQNIACTGEVINAIVLDGLNNSSSLFALSGGAYFTGNSAGTDLPATTTFVSEGSHSRGASAGTVTLTSNNNAISTLGYTNVAMSLKLAAFSINDAAQGPDSSDYITVEISPDGGTTWYNTMQVTGRGNSYWAFNATGVATTPYDGNASASFFASNVTGGDPAGYSTLNITNLPATSNLRVRISLTTNIVQERWLVDDFRLTGTLTASPTLNVTSALNSFTYKTGAGPSSGQSFTVAGSSLSSAVSIAAPTDYEISTTSNFASVVSPITLTPTSGNIATTTIYVRLKSGLSVATYNGQNIVVSGGGATSVNVSCNGEVINVIAFDGFNNAPSLFGATTTGSGVATYFGGISGPAAGPGSSAFASEGATGFGISSITAGTAILTGNANIDTSTFTNVAMSLKLAAFGAATSTGVDTADTVTIAVSPDGGTTYYDTLQITGRDFNTYWAHTATGTPTTAYDGDVTAVVVTPAGAGNQATGPRNISITNLPRVTNLRVRITLAVDDLSETWVVDDFRITGTPDTTAPAVTTLSPLDNATGVATNSNLVITFNENIVKGTGDIVIKRVSNGATVQTIAVSSTDVTVANNIVTINPPSDLVSATDYYVEIPNTAFRDASSNFYTGISGATTWNFTTILPTITAIAVTNNLYVASTTVASSEQTFTVSGINLSANLLLTAPSGYEIATISGGTFSTTINLIPTAGIVASTTIYVRLKSGLTVASHTGNITAESTNATTQNIACTGEVINAIAFDGLNNTAGLFALSGGAYFTGNSVATDRPATTTFVLEGSHSRGITNGTATLTSNNNSINTLGFADVALSMKLAAFSINSNSGLDAGDIVTIEISPDGGTTYYNTLQITGNQNANWGFNATGTATTAYDGNSIAAFFAPASTADPAGTRTTDGYSTLNITNLPSVANLRVRITVINDATAERWLVDDFRLTGTLTASPTRNVSAVLNRFTYRNTAGPSSGQSFTVSGSSLSSNIVITAPTNYDISLTPNFASTVSPITLTPTSGNLATTTIYVRLKAGLSTGPYSSENISITGGGVGVTTNVTCNGEVINVIAFDGFNNASSLFGISNTGTGFGTYFGGTSGSASGPGSSPFALEGATAFGLSSNATGTTILEGNSNIDTQTFENVALSFKLAAFGSVTTGGLDSGDTVTIAVSPDGGTTYYNTLQIVGGANSYWPYTATGTATTAYDGNVTAVTATAGAGAQLTAGLANISITNLPRVSGLRVRITLANDSNSETWVVDDFRITGTPDSTAPVVTTLSPTDGATGVTTTSNLVLTFNENVKVGTAGNIVIYNAGGTIFESIPFGDSKITFSGATVTINPAGTFVNGSNYYVQIANTAIIDIANNNYAGISDATSWNFTTESGTNNYFRTRQDGAWATDSNWESSSDGSTNWITATLAPTNAATAITILSTHDMTIASGSVTADDLTIATGGTLTISGGTFIVNNGTATTDLTVNGTLTYSSGTFTTTGTGIVFGANSTYTHSFASSTLTLPIATWNASSTCNVTGYNASSPTTGNSTLAQTFGNFTWNCSGQSGTGYLNIQQSSFRVNGTLTVGPSANNLLSFGNSGTFSNTINRIDVSGGLLNATGSATVTLAVTTSVNISGGTLAASGGSGTANLSIGTDLNITGGSFIVLNNNSSPITTVGITQDLSISGTGSLNMETAGATGAIATINVGRHFSSTSTATTVVNFGGGTVAGNIINIKGNFSKSGSGAFGTSSGDLATGFSFNGTTPQTFSYADANSTKTNYVVQTGASLTLNSNLTLGTTSSSFTVAGTLNFGTNSIIGNSGSSRFIANAGSTLATSNTNGLGGMGTTGSIRSFSTVGNAAADARAAFLAGANYTFNADTTTPFPNDTIGNPSNIIVNGIVTTNLTATLTTTGTTTINTAGSLTLNGNYNLAISNPLLIAEGGTFDNGGESQITNSGAITINGKFITRDAQGFVGTNTSITTTSRSAPTLGSNSTIEYGRIGDQAVQGLTAPVYKNITFSGGGVKTLASTNAVTGTITVAGSTTFDAGNSAFGSGSSNVTMTGASIYKLGGTTASKPESGGTYTLDPLSTFEFTGASNTEIRVSTPTINYANIIISGTAGNPATITGIRFQTGRTFTVKNGGVFKLNNTAGFTGSAATGIDTVTNGGPSVVLETGSIVEYTGSQVFPITQTITPASYSNLTISGAGTKTIANTTEVLVGAELKVTAGKLQIDNNRLLTVTDAIKNTSGNDIVINNGGNLVQVTNVDNATTNANTGNIKMTRTTRLMIDNDYIYWGSPVKVTPLSQIPSSFDSTYQWDLTGAVDGAWNALSSIVPGRGFIAKVASGVTTVKDVDFTGVPNNGTVTVTANAHNNLETDVSGNSILLANPYPSAIDAAAFVSANSTKISGTLYFWTSTTANTGGSYDTDDYATWNGTGQVAPNGGGPTPSGKIGSGQGFFALLKDDGDINFTNAMRVRTANENALFFKTTATNKTNTEKSRVWLNLTNDKNAFRQMLVGYITDATNGIDNLFDGPSFTGNEIDIYSIAGNKNLVIQGRALPFEDTDKVPLGVAITKAGTYKIAIDKTDGLLSDKAIFIEDKLANVVHNLKDSAYSFTIGSGTFNDRFILRYNDNTLGTNDVDFDTNSILVSVKNKQIKVNSANENINTITVYDLLGRQLFQKENVNNQELIISNLVSKAAVILVKVQLQNGATVSKKVIF